eukprot:Rmarinus@m.16538
MPILRPRRSFLRRMPPCACRRASVTTPISMPRRSMPRMLAPCSEERRTPSCPTGRTFLSGTTGVRRLSCSQAPLSTGLRGSLSLRMRLPHTARAACWTSSSRWASSLGPATTSATPSPWTPSKTRSSGWF